MPTFDPEETDELIDYIDRRFGRGSVADHEELDDGTVLVAITDTETTPLDYDDEEAQEAAREAIEAGDTFGVAHFNRHGEEIDSLWGMIGYGGAKKAIEAYKADYYSPYETPTAAPTTTAPSPSPAIAPPVRLSLPGDELSREEDRFINWMIQNGWYDKRSDAVAHVERMRRAGARIPGALQGLRPSLWNWERLGR